MLVEDIAFLCKTEMIASIFCMIQLVKDWVDHFYLYIFPM